MKLKKEILDGFRPIKLEIVIEDRQELEDLLARVNAPAIRINEGTDGWQANGDSAQDLFDLLSNEWANRNYDNKEDY